LEFTGIQILFLYLRSFIAGGTSPTFLKVSASPRVASNAKGHQFDKHLRNKKLWLNLLLKYFDINDIHL